MLWSHGPLTFATSNLMARARTLKAVTLVGVDGCSEHNLIIDTIFAGSSSVTSTLTPALPLPETSVFTAVMLNDPVGTPRVN